MKKMCEKLHKNGKGSGIYMKNKKKMVADSLRSWCYDKKCMKKIQKTGKGSGIYMKTMLWHKICEKVTRIRKR